MTNEASTKHWTLDQELYLHDGAAAVTSDGAGQVGGSAKVADLGASADFLGELVVKASAVDTANSDETYRIILQGSSASDMSGAVELASVVVTSAGTFHTGARNWRNGTSYQYVRAQIDVGGTTPSFTGKVYLSK